MAVLQLKALGIDNIVRFEFPSAPPSKNLIASMELLYALGALDDKGQLTRPLGNIPSSASSQSCIEESNNVLDQKGSWKKLSKFHELFHWFIIFLPRVKIPINVWLSCVKRPGLGSATSDTEFWFNNDFTTEDSIFDWVSPNHNIRNIFFQENKCRSCRSIRRFPRCYFQAENSAAREKSQLLWPCCKSKMCSLTLQVGKFSVWKKES